MRLIRPLPHEIAQSGGRARAFEHRKTSAEKQNFMSRFNAMSRTHRLAQNFSLRKSEIVHILSPSRSHMRGASRSSRTLKAGCDGRNGGAHGFRADERRWCGRRSRVVLAPLGWCQVGEVMISQATVTKRSWTPGRSRIRRNPSRRECRMIRLDLW